MKKNKLVEIIDKVGKANIYITVIVFVVIVSMSVGYAEFSELISAIGEVTIEEPQYEITNKIEFINYEDNLDNLVIESKEINDGFNVITKNKIEILSNQEYQVKYTLYNGTTSSYTYLGNEGILNSEEFMYPEIEGITKGDIILPGEKREVNVIFINSDKTYNLEYELVFTFKKGVEEVIKPNILGGLLDNKILLDNENTANVSMNITNIYDCSKKVSISVSNPDIAIISEYELMINKDATKNFNFTIKLNKDYQEPIKTSIVVNTKNGENYNIGEIILYRE